ncbi:hypothetical protein Cgig2_016780 [Carnegiea gigantea]|uniref:Uncharacterized protein n=1 Tax=Carnegiea gigantea TaxID=171969 RepID=A0A9Q1Q7M8_9CARY|nr:hypothetical protein Cgig2_016780 [Carnegiea gigantea]
MLRKNPQNQPSLPIPRETVSAVYETRKPIDESQNSSSCYSDKDSYVSTEKNIPVLVYCWSKGAKIDIKPNVIKNILTEPEVGKPRENTLPIRNNHARVIQRGKFEVSVKVLKPIIVPLTIELVADSPAIVPVKACSDSTRVHASASPEHQVLD